MVFEETVFLEKRPFPFKKKSKGTLFDQIIYPVLSRLS